MIKATARTGQKLNRETVKTRNKRKWKTITIIFKLPVQLSKHQKMFKIQTREEISEMIHFKDPILSSKAVVLPVLIRQSRSKRKSCRAVILKLIRIFIVYSIHCEMVKIFICPLFLLILQSNSLVTLISMTSF